MARKSTDQTARTQAELARALKVSGKTVSLWVHKPSWPFGKGPWNVREVDAWRSEALSPNPNTQPATSTTQSQTSPQKLHIAKTAAQISVLQERRQKLEIERLVLQKELVHRQDYEAKSIKNNTAIRIGLVRAAKSLRQHLADEDDPHEIEKMLVTAFRNLCDRINGPDDRGVGDG